MVMNCPVRKLRLAEFLVAAAVLATTATATASPSQRTDTMLPPNCPESDILPAALTMRFDYPQRMPYPNAKDDQVGVYGALTNGQRMALHLTPEIKAGLGALSGALLRNGSLPPSLREMIIVRTGYQTGSIYEVVQHRSLAGSLGVEKARLDSLACIAPKGLTDGEAAAIAFVDELLNLNRPTDAVLEGVRARFTDAQVFEMIFVTGNWWTLARSLETSGTPLDERRIGDTGVAPAADGH
jgi:alkylhydroperoxidase family enzyme